MHDARIFIKETSDTISDSLKLRRGSEGTGTELDYVIDGCDLTKDHIKLKQGCGARCMIWH